MSGLQNGEHMNREQLEALGYNDEAIKRILEIIEEA